MKEFNINIVQPKKETDQVSDRYGEFSESVSKELIRSFNPLERLEIINMIKANLRESLPMSIDEIEWKLKQDSDYLNQLNKIDY